MYFAHTGHRHSGIAVDAQCLTKKARRAGNYGREHVGNIDVDTINMRAVDLLRSVFALFGLANNAVACRVF